MTFGCSGWLSPRLLTSSREKHLSPVQSSLGRSRASVISASLHSWKRPGFLRHSSWFETNHVRRSWESLTPGIGLDWSVSLIIERVVRPFPVNTVWSYKQSSLMWWIADVDARIRRSSAISLLDNVGNNIKKQGGMIGQPFWILEYFFSLLFRAYHGTIVHSPSSVCNILQLLFLTLESIQRLLFLGRSGFRGTKSNGRFFFTSILSRRFLSAFVLFRPN